ncbi:hypothetical protein [uncultured Brevibacterium sp.]|uniref:hypothetical protein n=1 Tax=uncultured Brevibacterium sp. TaxID=189678 RepID=UPI0026007230|nr:hypothetical protein [uncultured Brevibacterium sp.]
MNQLPTNFAYYVPEELKFRDEDQKQADALTSGVLRIQNVVTRLPADLDWESAEKKLGPKRMGRLHSLEWLDVLRRVSPEVPDSKERRLWGEILASWAARGGYKEKGGPAWYAATVAKRLRVIAMGLPDDAVAWATAVVEVHIQVAFKWLRIYMASPYWEHLVDSIFLLHRRGFVKTEQMRAVIHTWVTNLVDDSGWIRADSLPAMEATRAQVTEWLERRSCKELDLNHEISRIKNREFARYLVKPNGEFLNFGSDLIDENFACDDPQVRHLQTLGLEGDEPPSQRAFLAKNGYVSHRSGYGEFERDCNAETMMTVLFGAGIQGAEHKDLGRITYFSDGVEWLVDPIGDDEESRAWHSTATLNLPHRPSGGVTLKARHLSDQSACYVFENTQFMNATHTRRLSWSDVGEYFVVEDSADRDDVILRQHWVVSPKVQINIADDGNLVSIWLRSEDANFVLHVSGSVRENVSVDHSVASMQRITILKNKISRSIVTWGGRVVKPLQHHVSIDAIEWGVIARTRESSYKESLAVRDGLELLADYEADSDELGEELLKVRVASVKDWRATRHDAMELVREVKARVWETSGALDARLDGINELKRFTEECGLLYSQHFGVGAGLVDLAMDDCVSYLHSGVPAGLSQRTPLINWNGSNMVHPFYKVPVHTTRRSDLSEKCELPNGGEGSYIHAVDYGDLVLPVYVHGTGQNIIAVFHGAVDRAKVRLPIFSMLRTLKEIENSTLLLFSDPTLDLHAGMRLSWYLGTERVNIHHEMARLIALHSQRVDAKRAVLAGSSGGGYAALQTSSYLPDSRVVVASPQIILGNYFPSAVERAYEVAAGTHVPDEEWKRRIDAVTAFESVDFARDVYYLQNKGDTHHVQRHFKPFVDAYKNSENAERLRVITTDQGAGHHAAKPEQIRHYIEKAIADA